MVYIECIHTSVLLQYKTWMYTTCTKLFMCEFYCKHQLGDNMYFISFLFTVRYQHIGNGKTK